MTQQDRNQLSRRGLLARAGAVAAAGAAASVAGTLGAGPAVAAPGRTPADSTAPQPTPFGPVSVHPGDARYDSLIRGNNFRFVGDPDEVRLVGSTDQVVSAVSDAVRSGRKVQVRSGGHCFENFTADPAVKMLIDVTPMDAVGFDPGRCAFAVQPGATLGHMYKTLYTGWGVTVPAGGCPDLCAGGHIVGGGYGPLSRHYGSVVDHLYAVEVVVVDKDGTVHPVVATRDPNDPNHDLWWAHAGGGGGNFGVVTRYWLRSPGATGTDPTKLLPPIPSDMLLCVVIFAWDDKMTETAFSTLLRNFGTWHEQNSAPGAPGTGLYSIFGPMHKSAQTFNLYVQADAGLPNVDSMATELVNSVIGNSGATVLFNERRTLPWLHATTWPGTGEPGDEVTRRYKNKAGLLRKGFTDAQLSAIYANMTNSTGNSNSGMEIIGYGGQVNTVASDATAVAQRDAIMKAVYATTWLDPTDDATYLGWVRNLYRDVYADTGGVPVPGDVSDGSYINYPDVDLADPAWNTSGVPWSTLYYQDNYPRLRQVKARWDPNNVFNHALSIEPPS